MNRKIIGLALMILLLLSATAIAGAEQTDTQDNWVAIELGKGNDDIYYFDKTSLHYDVDKDGNVNKNIIDYKEKQVTRDAATMEDGYYSITDCKINLANNTLLLGEATYYKSNGDKRWSETPTYLVWYTVQPGTVGGTRFAVVADYAAAHSDEIK